VQQRFGAAAVGHNPAVSATLPDVAHDDATVRAMVPDHDGPAMHLVIGSIRSVIAMMVVMPVAVLDHDAIGECRPREEKRGGGGSEQ
jgi:hypothetical protein